MSNTPRKYTRLSAPTWAEVRSLWEVGEVTLAELSARYAVSARTLQLHFSREGTVKGAKAADLSAAVRREIYAKALPDPDLLLERANATREAAYENAVIVESLIMAQLELAQRDPTQTLRAASALKALSLAASGLERLHSIKKAAWAWIGTPSCRTKCRCWRSVTSPLRTSKRFAKPRNVTIAESSWTRADSTLRSALQVAPMRMRLWSPDSDSGRRKGCRYVRGATPKNTGQFRP
jgi:hypothetical protein